MAGRRGALSVLLFSALFLMSGCMTSSPRFASRPPLRTVKVSSHQLVGVASYYADEFNGRTTANGEVYDMHGLTAAHRTLPFGTRVLVRNLASGKSLEVRINDRGPFKDNRVIDLSLEAAKRLEMISSGTAPVELKILEIGQPELR